MYAGFDPTADSLHIGNLLVLINLLHWQRGGHNVIAVVCKTINLLSNRFQSISFTILFFQLGGATAKIGDPSGRTTERDKLQESIVDENLQYIRKDIYRIFQNHEQYLWDKIRGHLKPPM